MEKQLFGIILHSDLMAHKLHDENKQKIVEVLIDYEKPLTLNELKKKLHLLASSFLKLDNRHFDRNVKKDRLLKQLPYKSDYPVPVDANSMIYQELISVKCQCIYNEYLDTAESLENNDCRAAEKILKEIGNFCRSVSQEIKKVTTDKNYQCSELKYFVLWQLKLQLIDLYFSVQDLFKGQLKRTVKLVPFYLLVLGETIYDIRELKRVDGLKAKPENKHNKNNSDADTIMSYGFIGDPNKLRCFLDKLSRRVEVVNDISELLEVLTARQFVPGYKKIRILCHVNQFRFLIDKLQPWFEDLSLINIEKSGLFISRKGKPISSNYLSVCTSRTLKPPKQWQVFESLFKELQ